MDAQLWLWFCTRQNRAASMGTGCGKYEQRRMSITNEKSRGSRRSRDPPSRTLLCRTRPRTGRPTTWSRRSRAASIGRKGRRRRRQRTPEPNRDAFTSTRRSFVQPRPSQTIPRLQRGFGGTRHNPRSGFGAGVRQVSICALQHVTALRPPPKCRGLAEHLRSTREEASATPSIVVLIKHCQGRQDHSGIPFGRVPPIPSVADADDRRFGRKMASRTAPRRRHRAVPR
jgi:hypothetical protein